jgi:hypothetical protein
MHGRKFAQFSSLVHSSGPKYHASLPSQPPPVSTLLAGPLSENRRILAWIMHEAELQANSEHICKLHRVPFFLISYPLFLCFLFCHLNTIWEQFYVPKQLYYFTHILIFFYISLLFKSDTNRYLHGHHCSLIQIMYVRRLLYISTR